jgi:hypothetical protein
LFAQNAFCADGLKEVLTPYQREVNMRSSARQIKTTQYFTLYTSKNYREMNPFINYIEDSSGTILFVFNPASQPQKPSVFLVLGGGILFKKGANVTLGPGVDTPRYQMSPLRGLDEAVEIQC